MKTLDDKVDKLSSDQVVDADCRGNDGRGVKRKRTKASLLIQVSFNAFAGLYFSSVNSVYSLQFFR